jgi:hypothetical protein
MPFFERLAAGSAAVWECGQSASSAPSNSLVEYTAGDHSSRCFATGFFSSLLKSAGDLKRQRWMINAGTILAMAEA